MNDYVPMFREREDILIKAGTVKELLQYEEMLDRNLYRAALRILNTLDEVYGPDRDVNNSDGGFVLIVENIQDISDISQRYVDLNSNRQEVVSVVFCEKTLYINALFLCNNEFGINVFVPKDIAPPALLGELPQKVR